MAWPGAMRPQSFAPGASSSAEYTASGSMRAAFTLASRIVH